MIAEFDWLSCSFLGVLIETIDKNKLDLKLELKWLEQIRKSSKKFNGFIWYPASFDSPIDQFESVVISPTLEITNQDNEKINFYLLDGFRSFGFEFITNAISNYNSFHNWIIEKIKINQNDKCINKRKIFYLDKLTDLNLDLLESKIQFDNIVINKIKTYLKSDEIELWNAFISYIPIGLTCPDQVIHRDCLYDSISLFFYLDESTNPKTQFFPYSHRLLSSIRDNLSIPFIPDLKEADVFLMDGKLFHGGLKGEVQTKDRILYVFQYRNKKETRSNRITKIKKLEDLAQKDIYKTVFKIR